MGTVGVLQRPNSAESRLPKVSPITTSLPGIVTDNHDIYFIFYLILSHIVLITLVETVTKIGYLFF